MALATASLDRHASESDAPVSLQPAKAIFGSLGRKREHATVVTSLHDVESCSSCACGDSEVPVGGGWNRLYGAISLTPDEAWKRAGAVA
jgi:hypothetical protein